MEKDEPDPDVKPQLSTFSPESVVTKSSLEEEHLSNQAETQTLKHFHCSKCFTTKQLIISFPKQYKLNDHMKKVHSPHRFNCELCLKPFYNLSDLKLHKQIHSATRNPEKIVKCHLCPRSFQTKYNLRRHLFHVHRQKCEGSSYFQCEFCPQEFTLRCLLEDHVLDEHVVDKEFQCPGCPKTFIDQKHLDKHVTQHDKQLKFFCDICSEGFQRNANLLNHLGVKHSRFFRCNKCRRSFSNKWEFEQHFLVSKTLMEFKCGICTDMFKSQCLLDIHRNSHLKTIKIEKKSKYKSAKFKHTKYQKGNQKLPKFTKAESTELYYCELCPKAFDRESFLSAHYVRIHLANTQRGPKPFKCPLKNCETSCASKSSLRIHLISHQREKPFKCEICTEAKTFKYLKTLKTHYRRNHSIFNFKKNAKSLKSKPCDEVVFSCSSTQCSYKTADEKKIALHYSRQHGLPKVLIFKTIFKSFSNENFIWEASAQRRQS